jgi:diguanylate cyclase (GGDEF)-like protein
MTLYRQLALGILVLLVLGYSSTVFINVRSLRDLMATQIESHARDTATSLGLSLSAYGSMPDLAVLESMTGAVFDRGDFRSIRLTGIDGQVLLEKSLSFEPPGVPDWFVSAIPLPVPAADALVMDGWQQTATVTVTGNPAHAYRKLWDSTLQTLQLYLLMASALLLAGLLAIRVLLRPLQRLRQQAEEISASNYTLQETLPRTRELRDVVIAMNRLSGKVSEIFREQSALVEQLREEAYRDPVTRLGNRRYFDRLIGALPGKGDTASQGALLLLELHDIGRLNETAGFAAGDALLKRAGELVAYNASQLENCYVARISGACFAIVAPGLPQDSAEALATTLCHELFQLRAENLVQSNNIGHIGLAMWNELDHPVDLLAAADVALRAAQTSGQNTWQRHAPETANQPMLRGAGQWRELLRSVIEQARLVLYTQPVKSIRDQPDNILHHEVLARIPDGSHRDISAATFMPMAERLGLASQLDKQIITKLVDMLHTGEQTDTRYAVNLTSTSLGDAVFIQWLCSTIGQHPALASSLDIEFPEYAATRDLQQTRNLVERLRALGCRCGIDHFGNHLSAFGYLRSIPVSYIKIDSSFTRCIQTDRDNQFFLQALADTLHSLDIRVYAQGVESRTELELLESLHLDGIQGYLCGRPGTLQGTAAHRQQRHE